MIALDIILLAAALIVLFPLAFFCLETLVSLWPDKRRETNVEAGVEGLH